MKPIRLQTYPRSSTRAQRSSRTLRSVLALLTLTCALGVGLALVSALPFGSANRADGPNASANGGANPSAPATRPPTVPAATPAVAKPSRLPTLTVAAAGDMLFDRRVGALIRASGGDAPLKRVASMLERADIAVANLESPLSSVGSRAKGKEFTFRGEPAAIEGLRLAGFDFLSLANNHALDYGPQALAETVSLLDAAGIGHAGAGKDLEAAWKPAVIERDGASVAFLSFSHVLPPGFIATARRPGIAQGRVNMDAVTAAIRKAAEEHDYVIVSFHWGVEYADDANAEQVRDGHAAVDAGADLVLSHHPHVIQGLERYGRALIAYSTGDFVFDHWSPKTGEAFVLEAELGPDGVGDVAVQPVYLDTNGRPEAVTGKTARTILTRLKRISAPLGGRVRISGSKATLL